MNSQKPKVENTNSTDSEGSFICHLLSINAHLLLSLTQAKIVLLLT